MTYNAEGKRTSLENLAGQVTTTAWDCCHKVSEVQPDGSTTTWDYDDEGRMGRRVQYLETIASTTNANNTFTYDNYLCISRNRALPDACTETDGFIWDPTEPIATRPLVFNYSTATPAYYTHDGNKNVSELVDENGEINAHYEYDIYDCYTPFICDNVNNPYKLSSEYAETSLGLICYNYRHYVPSTGRWINRDTLEEILFRNIYSFCGNQTSNKSDFLGLAEYETDFNNCILKVSLKWKVSFTNTVTNAVWNSSMEQHWKNSSQSTIESYFANINHKCYRQNRYQSESCCPNGISISVKVVFVEDEDSNAMSIFVSNDPTNRSGVNRRLNKASLDIADVRPQSKRGYIQVPIVHEVGHMLGLHHPGGVGNDHANYDADPESLMGRGMNLRISDFNSAFCDHISQSGSWRGR